MAARLSILNPNPRFQDGPGLLHNLISHAGNEADIAIEFEAYDGTIQSLTYEQLHHQSDALAAKLQDLRDEPGQEALWIIPLFIPQSLELYCSQTAVLKAGAAFCPIANDVPEDRLRFILRDVQSRILLTTSAVKDSLPPLEGITVVTVNDHLHSVCAGLRANTSKPSDPAYVMYTSGSTGTPKGVIISHSAATQALLAHDRYIPSFKRFLQFASPTFDVSVFEIFYPFFRGATLVACDRRKLLKDLPGVINRLDVDAAELTPSVAASLLCDRESVPGLRSLLTIGEMLKPSVVQEFGGNEKRPSILHGMYGPTEAAIHCTLQPSFESSMSPSNIGAPLDTVSAFIVRPADESTKPGASPEVLALGEEGELAVGGFQLAEGYLNRPEQTQAVFVNHAKHGRIYRTGDRAKMTPDGRIMYLGRISGGQVKLRGQRIELGEVEHAAAQTSGCRTSVAEVIDGALVVFCVPTSRLLTTNDVQNSCHKWLPKFMVPTDVVLLDSLPYLPSGKLNKNSLVQMYEARREDEGASSSFDDTRAESMAKIIGEILRAKVVPSTNLRAAGLDSLSAIRVSARLRREGLGRLGASEVLEAISISDLANLIDRKGQMDDGFSTIPEQSFVKDVLESSPIAAHRDEVQDIFAATPMQAAMLSETMRSPPAYCNQVLFQVDTQASADALTSAIDSLSKTHAMLRAGFVATSAAPSGYAAVVWKTLLPTQIVKVDDFDENLGIEAETDFLRPCCFQVKSGGERILLRLHMHHALYDQWSIDALRQDLSRLLKGQTLEAAAPFISISDMVAQNQTEQDVSYWQEHLRDMAITLLPNLSPKIVPRSVQRAQTVLENFSCQRARQQALGHYQTSLPTILQAAFALLFSSYCGCSDVTFGSVVSGRHLPIDDIERTFGPCLATLPFRTDVATARTCKDLVRLVQETNRSMLRRAFVPPMEIKRVSGVPAGESLFDVLFVWQESTLSGSDGELLIHEVESIDRHEFSLVLELEPRGDSLTIKATFQEALLPLPQVKMLFRQLQELANALLQSPGEAVSTFSARIDERLLSIANAQPDRCAAPENVTKAIQRFAEARPEATALVFASTIDISGVVTESLTYAALNERSNRMAHYLRSLGVSSGGLVGVCMGKSLNLYVALVAILKAGAGYVPMLPSTPEARIKVILRQSGVKVCLAETYLEPSLHSLEGLTCVVPGTLDLANFPSTRLDIKHCGSHVAYVVFTSGSTGEPKGVSVSHDNLNSNIAALAELYQVQPCDRMLQACSQAFDVSVFEIFFALSHRMTLCAATTPTLFQDLELSVRELQITHLSLTPTVAALLEPGNVPNVKFLVTAGEGVTDAVRRKWAGHGLNQGYGPSETTNICSVNMAMSPDDVLGNVGPPLRNTSAFVVAPGIEGLMMLPAGGVGELAFGGEQVFPGYLGRPDLDASRLITHPTLGRVYKSGDAGRILHDGSILVTGRIDHEQVKIRGQRVELGEISSIILRHQSVADCSTLLTEDGELAAFWVPRAHKIRNSENARIITAEDQKTAQLLELCRQHLPSYMIPRLVIPISKLPFTQQTKLDRGLLKSLIQKMSIEERSRFSATCSQEDDTAGLTELEQEVVGLLTTTLRISSTDISRQTSVFALGMNSLNGIALARRLSERCNRAVKLDVLLRNPTVRELAAQLEQHPVDRPPANLPEAATFFGADFVSRITERYAERRRTIKHILPCTPLQTSMLSSTSGNIRAYVNVMVLRVVGDPARLRECWQALISRHDILRTSFVETHARAHPYAQVVVEEAVLPWSSEPFNGPLASTSSPTMDLPFSLRLYKDGSETRLELCMLHALYDGNSMSILLEECEKLYRGQELPPTFAFEPFLRIMLDHERREAVQYWRELVHDFQPKPFPSRPDSDVQHTSASTPRIILTAELRDVDAFCRRWSITSAILVQAAWAKALRLAQSSDDVCFGTVVSGRSVPVPGIEHLVAPCFNTIPVKSKIQDHESNLAQMRALQAQHLASMEYQLTPLRRIQALYRRPEEHLFDSLVLLQPPTSELDAGIWNVVSETGLMDMPAILELTPKAGQYEAQLHYQDAYISPSLAEHLLSAFNSAFLDVIAFPSGGAGGIGDFDATAIAGKLRFIPPEASVGINGAQSHENSSESEHWSTQECAVRDAFAALSGVNPAQVTRSTSMYRLGLDSINAAQIASQLRAQGHEVDVADVIECLTPAAIANAIRRKQIRQPEPGPEDYLQLFDHKHRVRVAKQLHVAAEEVQRVLPCTATQCGMISQSLRENDPLYINHVAYRVPAEYNLRDINNAWTIVQRKHQILRTGFHQSEAPECPYLVVVWKAPALPLVSEAIDGDGDIRNVEVRMARDISKCLHSPCWRIGLLQKRHAFVMLLSIHHALYDAQGLGFLLSDLREALNGKSVGASLTTDALLLPGLGLGRDSVESESFWKATFGEFGAPRFPDLCPTVVERGDLQSISEKSRLRLCDIQSFCAASNATVQAVGQAAWARVLSAYTGEALVTFGTVFSWRSGSSSQRTAFPAITTVPVTCDTAGSSNEIIQRMVTYNSQLQRHKLTPLSDIQRFAGDAQRSLFDTVFVYQKSTYPQDDALDWPIVRESPNVDYAASLELQDDADGNLLIHFTFNTGNIPTQAAAMIIAQYDEQLRILTGELEHADNSLLQSIMPPKERSLPSGIRYLHEFLEVSTRNNPNHPALEFITAITDDQSQSRTWTHRELDNRANQVANLLRQNSINPGEIVAVRMEKCAEAVFAFVGILKAGCSFLAIDPELPAQRLSFILTDSAAAALLTSTDLVGKSSSLPTLRSPTIVVSEKTLRSLSTKPVEAGLTGPEATCYCLYTSGTTGTPKGCEITHENAVQAMLAFQRLFAGHWTPTSRWLQFASYWFDVSVLEMFWSWSVGITLVGAPRDLVLDDLSGFIRRAGITQIDLTPSLARLVHPDDVPSLQGGIFITGGEALKQEIIDVWGPKLTVCNGYGPTEATIGVTMNAFVGPNAKPANIGRQFDNVGTLVLRPDTDEVVWRGAVGELCVSGKLVGKGYLNRPDLTAKSFPFLRAYNERVYRTGDLVRLLHDGSFSFIGRKDTQTKLRGQRLEVGEIDSVIKGSASDIHDVVTIVVKDDIGVRQTLVSFFTIAGSMSARNLRLVTPEVAMGSVAAALSACRQRLPGYMVPSHLLAVTAIPLTVNNKVDTKKLAGFFNGLSISELQAGSGSPASDRPSSDVERQVCATLAELLKIDATVLGPDTNLFSVGLSSVSAISFAGLLKRRGLVGASVAAIMQNPVITHLASAVSAHVSADLPQRSVVRQARLKLRAFDQRHRIESAQRFGITVSEIEHVLPCTPLQSGMLTESFRHPQRPYFNVFQYRLGHVDPAAVHAALIKLGPHVEILRMRLLQTDDGFVQVVLRHANIYWQKTMAARAEISATIARRRELWLSVNQHDVKQPIRFENIHSTDGSTLVVMVHHALYDGISWEIFMDKLAQSCHLERVPDCGPSFIASLPYGPLRYLPNAAAFWQKRLPHSTASSGTDAEDDTVCTAKLLFDKADHLDVLQKRLGVSHQAIAQACFEVALQQHSATRSTYGMIVSGRSIPVDRADEIIGPLFNTLPVAPALQKNDTWASHIRRIHRSNAELVPYQHTPLKDIRRWCGEAADFDTLFTFQHQAAKAAADEQGLWRQVGQPPSATHGLAVEVTLQHDGNLHVVAVAKGSVANTEALEDLLGILEASLSAAVSDQDERISAKFEILDLSPGSDHAIGENDISAQLNGVYDFEWSDQAITLRRLIAEVAGVDDQVVDEHTSIFTLGLDSIDSVKLASKTKNAGIQISLSQILRAQTIPRMLAALDNSDDARPNADEKALDELTRRLEQAGRHELHDLRGVEAILPASPTQEALIADMLKSDFADYYNHDVLRLASGTDLDRMKAALRFVVENTPILRTGFWEVSSSEIDGTFAQVIWTPDHVAMTQMSVENESDLETILANITSSVRSTPLLQPLLRLTAVECAGTHYLVLSLAHAQYDGHSLGLLHDDFRKAYHDILMPRPAYHPLLEASLAGSSDRALSFWSGTLSGIAPKPFPTRPNARPGATHRATHTSILAADVIRSFCREQNLSAQSLFFTAWSLLLASYTQTLEPVFGAVLACRETEEEEAMAFPAMNTVPVRAALHGTYGEMLKYMHDFMNDVRPHQRTSLRDILRGWGGEGKLFDTLFIFQHRPDTDAVGREERLYESVGGKSEVEYPVAVEAEMVGQEVVMRAAGKSEFLDAAGVKTLLERLDDVLQAMVKHSDTENVEFTDRGVKVAGLEEFELEDDRFRDAEHEAYPKAGTTTEPNDQLTTIASSIRDTLSRVGKVPPESISSSTSIESIGIDSISAIKVCALLRKQDIHISVSELLTAKTVKRMGETAATKPAANGIGGGRRSREVIASMLRDKHLLDLPSTPSIPRHAIETVLPATAGQVYMLSTWYNSAGQLFYPTFSYRLRGRTSPDQLRTAWEALVTRHAILRTRFCTTEDEDVPVLQVVLKHTPLSFFDGPSKNQRMVAQPMASLTAHAVEGGYQLALRIHHALYDAISLPLLMADYQALLSGQQGAPIPSPSFADFVALTSGSSAKEEAKGFWTAYLAATSPLHLPRSSTIGPRRRTEIFSPGLLDSTATSALEATARREEVSMQTLFFAAYAQIYASLTSSSAAQTPNDPGGDVVLGIYSSLRSLMPELENVAAPTLNLLPLLVRAPATRGLLETAKGIQRDLRRIGAARLAGVGLWEVEAWTGVGLDTFANWLGTSDWGEEGWEAGTSEETGVVIASQTDRRREAHQRIVGPSEGDEEEEEEEESGRGLPEELRGLAKSVRAACRVSLDIEARITAGALDIGLFCPEEMLGLESAKGVMEALKALLEDVAGRTAKG